MADPTAVLYQPNSRDTSRYTIPPLQRNEIFLEGDRNRGEFFPSIEGEFIYIDRCDLACTISLVTTSGVFDFMARDGLSVRAPFRGLILNHYTYSTVNGAKPSLVFYTAKEGVIDCALNEPIIHLPPAVRNDVVDGEGGSIRYFIPVPRGARVLKSLRINEGVFVADDLIPAGARSSFTFVTYNSLEITTPDVTTPTEPFVPYANHPRVGDVLLADGANNPNAVITIIDASTNLFELRFEHKDIPIPNQTLELDVRLILRTQADLTVTWHFSRGEGGIFYGAQALFA
jgi:hypothetical protein